jgi:uncharacterized protein (DUF1778 family)
MTLMARTRSRQLNIRLTEPEYARLLARASTANASMTRFIIDTAACGRVRFYAPDERLLKEMRTALKKNGTLLNQIAHRLNRAADSDTSREAALEALAVLDRLIDPQLACLDAIDTALAKTRCKEA